MFGKKFKLFLQKKLNFVPKFDFHSWMKPNFGSLFPNSIRKRKETMDAIVL